MKALELAAAAAVQRLVVKHLDEVIAANPGGMAVAHAKAARQQAIRVLNGLVLARDEKMEHAVASAPPGAPLAALVAPILPLDGPPRVAEVVPFTRAGALA